MNQLIVITVFFNWFNAFFVSFNGCCNSFNGRFIPIKGYFIAINGSAIVQAWCKFEAKSKGYRPTFLSAFRLRMLSFFVLGQRAPL